MENTHYHLLLVKRHASIYSYVNDNDSEYWNTAQVATALLIIPVLFLNKLLAPFIFFFFSAMESGMKERKDETWIEIEKILLYFYRQSASNCSKYIKIYSIFAAIIILGQTLLYFCQHSASSIMLYQICNFFADAFLFFVFRNQFSA